MAGWGQGRPAAQELGPLSDVDRLVGNPFKIHGNPHTADDEPQIAGHGLIQGEQAQRLPIDIDLEQVDFLIAFDDFIRQLHVPFKKGLHGFLQSSFGQRRHLQDHHPELFQFLVKTTLHELTS